METIQVTKETKQQFEQDRFRLRMKKGKIITQEEFIIILLKQWRIE